MKIDLKKIIISAELFGKYQPVSIDELFKIDRADLAMKWVIGEFASLSGLEYGQIMKRGHIIKLIKILQKYRLD